MNKQLKLLERLTDIACQLANSGLTIPFALCNTIAKLAEQIDEEVNR